VVSRRWLRGVCAISTAVPELGAPKAAINFDGCAPTVPDELAAEGVVEVAASAAPAQGVGRMADESDPRSRFRRGSQACGRGWPGPCRAAGMCRSACNRGPLAPALAMGHAGSVQPQ
jgi:hypothetical protein